MWLQLRIGCVEHGAAEYEIGVETIASEERFSGHMQVILGMTDKVQRES